MSSQSNQNVVIVKVSGLIIDILLYKVSFHPVGAKLMQFRGRMNDVSI